MAKKSLIRACLMVLSTFSLVSCTLDDIFGKISREQTGGSTQVPSTPSENDDSTPSDNSTTDRNNTTTTTSTSTSTSEDEGTISLFSVNDFHGKIKQTSSYSGMVALQGAIKGNTLYSEESSAILSAGDMWQGSYASGLDQGLATTKLMNEFSFSAMCLGNHEFDWGFDAILKNEEAAEFPFLCANLIDTTTKQRPSQIKDHVVLDINGYKLGIIGAIGSEQETSIKASALGNHEFSSDLNLLKTAAASCRSEGARANILLLHDGIDETYTNSIQTSGLDVVGIFGGHTHRMELEQPSGQIPYVQGYCNSLAYSYMTIDRATNKLTSIGNTYVDGSLAENADVAFETNVNALLLERQTPVIGTIQGTWSKDKTANFVLRAMFYACQVQYPDKDYSVANLNLIAVHNTAGIRGSFPSSSKATSISMEDIQIVSPFDNKVMLISNRKVYANSIGQYYYSYPGSLSYSGYKTMDVVTIDYVTEKNTTNSNSIYYAGAAKALQKDDENYIIYDCIADYVTHICADGSVINASDYA